MVWEKSEVSSEQDQRRQNDNWRQGKPFYVFRKGRRKGNKGQRGSDQKRVGVRIQAVVDPLERLAADDQRDPPSDGRCDGGDEPARRIAKPNEEQDRRPHKIELLFLGDRPCVSEPTFGKYIEGAIPVHCVGRRDQRRVYIGIGSLQTRRKNYAKDNQRGESRPGAKGATRIESPDINVSGARHLLNEKTRDQEAA